MGLRPYQQTACERAWAHLHAVFGSDEHGLISMPTGSGKSHVIAELIRRSEGGRVLCVVPTKELVTQNVSKIEGPVSVYCAGLNRREQGLVTVGTINSCFRATWPKIDLLIVDEAHLIQKGDVGMYRTLILALQDTNQNVCILGLTATPFRADGSGYLHLGEGALFKSIVYEVPMRRLVDEGYLVKLVTKRTTVSYDLTDVSIAGGDYAKGELEQAIAEQTNVTRDAVKEALRRSEGCKRRLWFCASVEQAELVGELLDADIIIGKTPKAERVEMVDRFKRGETEDLVNVFVLTTGFDCPEVNCLVILRPTQSSVLWVQMNGRGMRPSEGKDSCLVLDFGDSALRLGTVDNPTVTTSKGDGEAPMKVCPECESIVFAGVRVCPDCEFEFPAPESSIDAKPSEAPVYLDTQAVEHMITEVSYFLHHKKDSPVSLRVIYHNGFGEDFPDWWCFAHKGFAGRKAMASWYKRGGNKPSPKTAEEALERTSELRRPKNILVKPDGNWVKVVGYVEFDDPPF